MHDERKQKMHQEIWSMWQILQDVQECYSLTKYLNKPDSQEELDYINLSLHFRFIRSLSWKMTVIELAKIFISSNNHHFNLKHFIDKLKQGQELSDCALNKNKIKLWEEKLIANQKLIKQLQTQRDKFYAHTDKDREENSFDEILFSEIDNLISLAESVIREIYSIVLDAQAEIENVVFENGKFPHIKILVEEGKRKRQEMIEMYNKKTFTKNLSI